MVTSTTGCLRLLHVNSQQKRYMQLTTTFGEKSGACYFSFCFQSQYEKNKDVCVSIQIRMCLSFLAAFENKLHPLRNSISSRLSCISFCLILHIHIWVTLWQNVQLKFLNLSTEMLALCQMSVYDDRSHFSDKPHHYSSGQNIELELIFLS